MSGGEILRFDDHVCADRVNAPGKCATQDLVGARTGTVPAEFARAIITNTAGMHRARIGLVRVVAERSARTARPSGMAAPAGA